MIHRILLLIVLFGSLALSSHAQPLMAKLKYEEAEKAYQEGAYQRAFELADETEKILKTTSPKTSYLKILARYKMELSIADMKVLQQECLVFLAKYGETEALEDMYREIYDISKELPQKLNDAISKKPFLRPGGKIDLFGTATYVRKQQDSVAKQFKELVRSSGLFESMQYGSLFVTPGTQMKDISPISFKLFELLDTVELQLNGKTELVSRYRYVHRVPEPLTKAYLGVTYTEAEDHVVIDQIEEGSAADKAGFRVKDKITLLSSASMKYSWTGGASFGKIISANAPGDQVIIEYTRDGKRLKDKYVTLGERVVFEDKPSFAVFISVNSRDSIVGVQYMFLTDSSQAKKSKLIDVYNEGERILRTAFGTDNLVTYQEGSPTQLTGKAFVKSLIPSPLLFMQEISMDAERPNLIFVSYVCGLNLYPSFKLYDPKYGIEYRFRNILGFTCKRADQGVVLIDMYEGVAYDKGLRAGDLITSFDGKVVNSPEDMFTAFKEFQERVVGNKPLVVTYLRNGISNRVELLVP